MLFGDTDFCGFGRIEADFKFKKSVKICPNPQKSVSKKKNPLNFQSY
jgi:hypothetical protein